MSTAVTITNNGEEIGRCTGRCYDAHPSSPYSCVCRGLNHGIGRLEAEANLSAVAALYPNAAVAIKGQQVLGGLSWLKGSQ